MKNQAATPCCGSKSPVGLARPWSKAKLFRLLAVFQLISIAAFADWTTAANGNWNDPATWTANAVPPTSGSLGIVTISHTVTLNQNATATTLTINAGSLTIPAGTSTLSVTGTATVANGAVFTNNSNNASYITIANFVVANGGTYNHNATGSSSNGATTDFPGSSSRSFGATSNVVITKWASGGTTPVPLPASGSPGWGNLKIDVATLGGAWKQNSAITNIQGDLIINKVGANREFRLYEVVTGSVNTLPKLTIKGSLIVNGGLLAFLGGSTSGSASTLNVFINGDIQIKGGTLNLTGNNGFTSYFFFNFNYCNVYLSGNLTITSPGKLTQPKDGSVVVGMYFVKPSGTQTISSYAGGADVVYIGFGLGDGSTSNTIQLLTPFEMTNVTTLSNLFYVYNHATLIANGENYVSGNTSFQLQSGASIQIGSANGITSGSTQSGNIRTTGGRSYSSSANYAYTGSYNQVTGSGLPTSISGNLSMINTGVTGDNKVTLTNTLSLSGVLSLQDGLLTTTNKLLTLTSAGSIDPAASGSDASFVNGPMARGTNSTSEYVFPVGKPGTSDTWRPVGVKPAATSAATFLAEYFAGPTPNNSPLLGAIGTLENNEYWYADRTAGSTAARVKLNYEFPGNGLANWTPVDPCAACDVAVAQYNTTGSGYWEFTTDPTMADNMLPEVRPKGSDGNLFSAELSSFTKTKLFTAAVHYALLLPVKILSFSGAIQNDDILLRWTVAKAENARSYTVEYSRDGINFSRLATVQAGESANYEWTHYQAGSGKHFYRLVAMEKDGQYQTSKITVLEMQSDGCWRLAGNVVTNQLSISGRSSSAGRIAVKIIDAAGKICHQFLYNTRSGNQTLQINVGSLAAGSYFIVIEEKHLNPKTIKFSKIW